MKATAVSFLSAIVSITGGILFAWPAAWDYSYWIIGAGLFLFHFFAVLDCVDGNVARVSGTASSWGAWADAITGFITYTSMFFSIGLYVYWRTQWWPALLITGFTSSANLLTRVAYQIYKNIVGEEAYESVSVFRTLAENTGITGFLSPLLTLFHFFSFLPGMWFIVWFNAVFYSGGCAVTLLKLGKKALKNVP
jgi:phosphatidylglycerophosphate synthase